VVLIVCFEQMRGEFRIIDFCGLSHEINVPLWRLSGCCIEFVNVRGRGFKMLVDDKERRCGGRTVAGSKWR
jgi:hypothetical protein